MRFKQVFGSGGTGEHIFLSGKNSDTVPIVRGTPVILSLNGTDDGFAVVLPSTAGQAKSNAFVYGVGVSAIPLGLPVGVNDDFQAYGYCPYALVSNGTRSATTASWNSQASWPEGAALSVDTVNNAFAIATASDISAQWWAGFLVDTIASYASSASATSDTRTAIVAGYRCFIHML